MKNPKNIYLLCASLLIFLFLFEISIRGFVKPSERGCGVLYNKELPPFKVKIRVRFHANYDEWIRGLKVNGKKITKGDLWGILTEDRALGYAPKKSAVSTNGWWQSNNIGARARDDTPRDIPAGMERVLIFGESFANCSRLPQEETWPFLLNQNKEKVEFINLGVDGYSMGQCLLRYRLITKEIDYDVVLLVFVPSFDLWRDINVLRLLGGWQNYPLLPRFIIENDRLKLIESPYGTWNDFFNENREGISVRLRDHLRAYDRFYFRTKYESPFLIGEFILYKLLARKIYTYQEKVLGSNITKTDSEAMTVSRKIFEAMNEETKNAGKKFVLIYLPSRGDVNAYKYGPSFRLRYDKMVSSIAEKGITYIDLMQDFLSINPAQFDTSYYDRVHYGPKSNKIIAGLIWDDLKKLKILTK